MLRRNYRRTRSDETDVRSATGDELTGALTVSVSECRPQPSGRDRTTVADTTGPMVAATATSVDQRPGAGGGGADNDDDDDDWAEDGDSAPTTRLPLADGVDDGSSLDGHDRCHNHHNRHHHDRDVHRPATLSPSYQSATPYRHNPSVGSADTEMTSLDTRELWLPDTEPTPSTMSALHQFGAEMLRLSRGLEKAASPESKPVSPDRSDYRSSDNGDERQMDDDDDDDDKEDDEYGLDDGGCDSLCSEETTTGTPRCRRAKRQRRRRRRRRSGTLHESMRRRFDGHHYHNQDDHRRQSSSPVRHHRTGRPTRVRSFHEDELRRNRIEPIATTDSGPKIVGTLLKPEYQRKPGLDEEIRLLPPPPRRRRRRCSASANSSDATAVIETPSSSPQYGRPVPVERTPVTKRPQPTVPSRQSQTTVVDTVTEWSAASGTSKTVLVTDNGGGLPLRRAMTQKLIRKRTATGTTGASAANKRHAPLARYGSTLGLPSQRPLPQQQQQQQHHHHQQARPQRSTNASRSSVMIRNSYRHGRIIRLEQKATKVLGVVFFTFVFLWTPFFALNLLPSVCPNCEANTNKGLIDLVTWLGYASSMVNPVFYTIFNKVFRQAFKRVLQCKYRGRNKRHSWPPQQPARKV